MHFWIKAPFCSEIQIDQSISHNGVCLTVTEIKDGLYRVTAIDETLVKTNLSTLIKGSEVNLERCMKADGRFDGHLVQGHVDCTAELISVTDSEGSKILKFQYPEELGITVEKGSVCVNGISLTVINSANGQFSTAIIPYTWDHTNLRTLNPGNKVNIEFDIVGKYIARIMQNQAG